MSRASGEILSELDGLHALPGRFENMTDDKAVKLIRDGKATMIVSQDRLLVRMRRRKVHGASRRRR